MALFGDANKGLADSIYEASREHLRKQNGLTHVMCYYLFSQIVTTMSTCEEKITDQTNQIIVAMQKEGYEILDVKIVPTMDTSSFNKNRNGFLLTITYK